MKTLEINGYAFTVEYNAEIPQFRTRTSHPFYSNLLALAKKGELHRNMSISVPPDAYGKTKQPLKNINTKLSAVKKELKRYDLKIRPAIYASGIRLFITRD